MTGAPEALAAQRVRDRIRAACERAGRDPAGVTLLAATKTVAPERIVASGVADAGENRVQELLAKQEALRDLPLRWHFIGIPAGAQLVESVELYCARALQLCRCEQRTAGLAQRLRDISAARMDVEVGDRFQKCGHD
jgi:alkanesulfonate monooxygenase SsuD/methylene tetrahydromethanopterin reductase-like flavin-dependent oxidoreductase (luciferase family)